MPKRDTFEATLRGEQDAPYIPRLRDDPPPYHPQPHSIADFIKAEGRAERKRRLQELWKRLPVVPVPINDNSSADLEINTEAWAKSLQNRYDSELLGKCGGQRIGWNEFKSYAYAKEAELWSIFHNELDLDGNGRLDAAELGTALRKAGIALEPSTLTEFMTFLTSSPHSHAVTFAEFRDFLLLLPRQVSTSEIYQYYEVRKYMGDDGRGSARLTMEGDVSLSAEDKPPLSLSRPPAASLQTSPQLEHLETQPEHEEEEAQWLEGQTTLKYLLAGGVAGAVSRTCTAPFDRLKIFLITRPPDLGGTTLSSKPTLGVKVISNAVVRIYSEGGVLAFWTGNGLSVGKIFPESAIKFWSYEQSKRVFAKYWDGVEDTREISGLSRFLSGGIGGITSQFSIYPIETLKTQMMSSTGRHRQSLLAASRSIWASGGYRGFYPGLTIGLIGVFPYSAIDMSTFEALKLAYLRSTGKQEPGVMAILSFGAISGSVGATSVYPLNLVRTRLQASGSSGHPQKYTGVWDVCAKTFERDGWRGFYRGLLPTLAKVVPAVSISYVVYDAAKRKLVV